MKNTDINLADYFSREFRFVEGADELEQPRNLFDIYQQHLAMGRPDSFWAMAALLAHRTQGAQMWVSRQVSDDLSRSVIPEPHFEDVAWPLPSIEFVWEDPTIPMFILRNNQLADVNDWALAKIRPMMDDTWVVNPPPNPGLLTLLAWDMVPASQGGPLLSHTSLRPEEMNKFAMGMELDIPHRGDVETDKLEIAALHEMALLAFKVLMFAGVPRFKARKTQDPPTKKEGGKPGFMHRPKTDRYIVQYLPRQIQEKRHEAEIAGKSHTFKGRLGHLRTYKSDRYTYKKGQTDYMWPIPDPNGNYPKRNFKVTT